MGIRVDENSLDRTACRRPAVTERAESFHSRKPVLNKELPYTIGGGIGQSRICMFFLRKAHIGEVHVSLWPKEMQAEAARDARYFQLL